ncbi:hypothetical protein [Burkholderia ubonensis]|uniref:hypothetical protein n=1 Tax=Burkholderia ubonensis TaxID=101571 RepID=UPI00075A65AF|nr:hypothetical protein [Burkholderia ubonensis]KVP17273.1 hypothetical protein WJ84_03300 [Burkholderia ubonensis]
MTKKNSADRHKSGSVQLKAWLPEALRSRFNACCKAQGVPAAAVLRDLMEAYCAHVDDLGTAVPEEAARGAR